MTERERIRIKFKDAITILAPYIYNRLKEQLKSCLPITLYLVFFLLFIFRGKLSSPVSFSIGIGCVVFGLMFFMEGLRLGLMPFAENIGDILPKKASAYVLFGFAFLIGVGATLAEPAIGVLRTVGYSVNPSQAPVLYDYLLCHTGVLVAMVAGGVGIAVVLGILRFIKLWSLKIFIFPVLILVLLLSVYAHFVYELRSLIGMAWDCGGITTGPVTVPLVLALGIGVTRARGAADTGMSGFGIVTLASLFPILFVLIAGISMYHLGLFNLSPEKISPPGIEAGIGKIILDSISYGVRAIVPLMLFLYFVMRFVLKESLEHWNEVLVGIGFSLLGIVVLNLGLGFGLTPLGAEVGAIAPRAFASPEMLYGDTGGKILVLVFAFFLGYGATVAEPALNALGISVEEITQGAFKKFLLIHSVAFGVGIGIALGVAKMVWDIPITFFLVPMYLLLIPLTLISSEEFVNISWDGAGVTTGPITVPLILSLGLGIGGATSALDGFGIISLASVCPIIVVLVLGLYVKYKLRETNTKRGEG